MVQKKVRRARRQGRKSELRRAGCQEDNKNGQEVRKRVRKARSERESEEPEYFRKRV